MRRVWRARFWLTPLALLVTICSIGRAAGPDDTMIVGSRAIVTGRVLSVQCGRDQNSRIFTFIAVRLLETIKGDLSSRNIVLKQEGGRVEDEVSTVFGTPLFSVGEKVLLYLDTWSDGSLRVHEMFLGKFSIVTDPATGGQTAVRPAAEEGVVVRRASTDSFLEAQANELVAYTQRIRAAVAATAERSRLFEQRHYLGVPLLAEPPEYEPLADKGALQTQFSTFSQTQPPRWFEPDTGQPVVFLVNPEGAPNPQIRDDITAAMIAWSTVPGSNLVVKDGGEAAGCPDRSRNTILFNNCDGRFAPVEGCARVIALGILNWTTGVSKQVSGTTFYKVTNASVAFNPYSACSFTDHCVVQEIATHELGHALGFGHSHNPDATMYGFAHFDGRCATLRQDDQDAANFSYPLRDPGPIPFQITTPAQLTDAAVGLNHVYVFGATGGARPYVWGWVPSQGRLPVGLSFYPQGILAGRAAEAGSTTFTLETRDAQGVTLERAFTVQVRGEAPQYDSRFTTQTIPVVVEAGQPFAITMKWFNTGVLSLDPASGLSLVSQNPASNTNWGTDRIAVIGAPVPSAQYLEIRFTPTAPTTAGTYTFQWQLFKEGIGAFGQVSTASAIRVVPPERPIIGGPSFFETMKGSAFSVQLAAIGGKPPYVWSVAGGALPSGIVLNTSTGLLSGTPATIGSFAATMQAADTEGQTGQKQIIISVLPPPLSMEGAGPVQAVKGVAFSHQLRANGGAPGYSWSITSGALPAGLSLDSATGLIAGTPTEIGMFSAGVTVRDQANQTATAQLQIRVLDPETIPAIYKAKYKAGSGKLIVAGDRFDPAATLLVDNLQRAGGPSGGRFVVKGLTLSPGQHEARVMNPNGIASQPFVFTVN